MVEKILAEISPLIITNVRKSLGKSNYRTPLGPQTTVYENGKQSSGFNSKGSDNELVEKILAELSPFIEGAITSHFSNENVSTQSKHDSEPDFYIGKGAGGDDKQFVNSLISELLPTIQTLIRGQLGK